MIDETKRIISAELLKLAHRRSTWIVPLLLVALVILSVLGLEFAARRHWVGLPSGYFVASSAIGWLVNVLVLVVVIAGAFAISGEFALGTIRSSWVRPISRRAWYLGKVITTCSIVGSLFLLAALTAIVAALIRLGFTDLMENAYLVHSSASLAGRLALTLALTLWGLWAATVFMTMVASMFSHPGGAIAVGLGVGVVFMALSIFPPVRPLLLTTIVTAPIEQMAAMAKGIPLPHEWGTLVNQTLWGAGLWLAGAAVIGDRIINRKQITS